MARIKIFFKHTFVHKYIIVMIFYNITIIDLCDDDIKYLDFLEAYS